MGWMMEYTFEGQQVQRLCFDYAVSIEAADGAVLRIEAPFEFSPSGDEPFQTVDPGRLAQSTPLFSVLNDDIVHVSVNEQGALFIRFAKGQALRCEPDRHFEAWSIVAPSGEQMVCLPGGGVSVFPGVQEV
jgi:hypothetical protein